MSVEQNIKFFKEISELYRIVKAIALKRGYLKSKRGSGKTICVLITSNQHFYGELDAELTNFYLTQTKNLACDRLVIGNMGKSLLKSLGYSLPFESIIFKKEFPLLDELKSLADKVFEYSKVLVYHSKFVTILDSEPTVSDITASDTKSIDVVKTGLLYIFEPDVDKMIQFFESQILILLFQTIFLEADITRQAARMIAMNSATDNAGKLYEKDRRQILQAKKRLLDLQIQETYAGILNK